MIYTEYQQVLLTQLQNNDKIIEEIKKEQEEANLKIQFVTKKIEQKEATEKETK